MLRMFGIAWFWSAMLGPVAFAHAPKPVELQELLQMRDKKQKEAATVKNMVDAQPKAATIVLNGQRFRPFRDWVVAPNAERPPVQLALDEIPGYGWLIFTRESVDWQGPSLSWYRAKDARFYPLLHREGTHLFSYLTGKVRISPLRAGEAKKVAELFGLDPVQEFPSMQLGIFQIPPGLDLLEQLKIIRKKYPSASLDIAEQPVGRRPQ